MNVQHKKIAEIIKNKILSYSDLRIRKAIEGVAKDLADLFAEEDREWQKIQHPLWSDKYIEEEVQKNKSQFLKIARGEE